MRMQLEGDGPLYERLYRALCAAIVDGRLAPGARMPSTRSLADELAISRTVVVAAYAQLLGEGRVEGRAGSGTYVAAQLAPPSPARARASTSPSARLSRYARRVVDLVPYPRAGTPGRGQPLPYDFRYGRPAVKEFPQTAWAALVARRARDGSIRALDYGPPAGHLPLRAAIADQLLRARGIRTTAEHIMIVSGAQQALDLVTRLVIDPGAAVVVEDPTYPVARQVFRAAGARVVPVAVDRDGLQVALLPRRSIRLAYVTPSHQFPLGAILPAARRLALVSWAARTGAYILEDDYDSELSAGATSLAAVQSLDRQARVIYMGTFSKVLFPALRLGYLVLPAALVAPATALKMLMDTHTALFEQDVLAEFMREGQFERHVRRTRARCTTRRAALVEAVAQHLAGHVELSGAEAGVHAVAHLPHVASRALPDLVARAAARGVGLYPLGPHYARAQRRGALLLGYAALSEHEIRTGIGLLGEVMARR